MANHLKPRPLQAGAFCFTFRCTNPTIKAKEPNYTHTFTYPLDQLKKGESAVEKFAELSANPIFVQHGFDEDNALLLYVAYMGYGSGLHKTIPDWRNRKKEAARLAGLLPTDAHYEAALNLTHEGVQAMRVEWIRQFCPMEFAEFDALVEFYYQTLTEISKAKTASAGKDLATEYKSWMALATDLPPIRKQIQELAEKLFMGDEEIRRVAMENAKPRAEAGSAEEAIFKRRGRK